MTVVTLFTTLVITSPIILQAGYRVALLVPAEGSALKECSATCTHSKPFTLNPEILYPKP